MAQILGLPKLSPTMEEGVLVRWTKKEGDKVSPGDLIAEVETDKANMDFNVEDEGVLLKLLVKEGDTVKLGAPVAIIGNAGEDVAALVEQAKGGGGGDAPAKPAAKTDAKPAAKTDARPAADAKPAAKTDAKPAAKTDAKPAARTDAKPAARTDAKPAAKADAEQTAPAKQGTKPAAQTDKPAAPRSEASGSGAGRLLASPLAKTLAIELGIDLRQLTGSGPGGRIVERDVRAAADGQSGGTDDAQAADAQAPTDGDAHDVDAHDADAHDADAPDAHDADADADAHADAADDDAKAGGARPSQALAVRSPARGRVTQTADGDGDWDDVPASNMRKRIAARLTEAKRDVPHFYLMRDLDAGPLLAYRQRLNELLGDKGKISVNDLVIKAAALALRRLPDCNASWQGESIRKFHRVHIGVAVAIPDGLVTPVVRDADQKGIGSIAAEVKDLAERAKSRGLKSHEITGSTFSVSNLGMFGVERFTAILNPPEAGILAVGAVRDVAVVDPVKGVIAGKRMTVTMSCDHRVIDGALGARWLQVFGELIEKPESLAL